MSTGTAVLLAMAVFVLSSVVGGVLVNGIVIVAGVASSAPSLSRAAKVNVTGALPVPLGLNFSPSASAWVMTWFKVTKVVPSAKYKVPLVGRVTIL